MTKIKGVNILDSSRRGVGEPAGESEPTDQRYLPSFLRGSEKIAMLEVYMDDSGSHSKKTFVIGGVVGEADKWEAFINECKQIQTEFDIPYFHAVEFRKRQRGVFAHLNERRRDDLLEKLTNAICEAACWGTFAVISPLEFVHLTTQEWRSRHGSAMKVCIEAILLGIWQEYTNRGQTTETINVVIESGHKNSRDALDAVLQYKKDTDPYIGSIPLIEDQNSAGRGNGLLIGTAGISDKANMPPLWAADIVAYCIYGQLTYQDDPFYAQLLREIQKGVRVDGFHMTGDVLRQWVEDPLAMDQQTEEWKQKVHGMTKALRPLGFFPTKHEIGVKWNIRYDPPLITPVPFALYLPPSLQASERGGVKRHRRKGTKKG